MAMLVAGIVQNNNNGQVREGNGQLPQQSSYGVGIDGIRVGDSEQLSFGCMQGTQNVEALSASRGLDEKTDKGPQKPKERLQDKVVDFSEQLKPVTCIVI